MEHGGATLTWAWVATPVLAVAVAKGRAFAAAAAVLLATVDAAIRGFAMAVTAQPRTLEIYEEVVGSLENVMDPKIAAEVAGRVTRVLAFTGKRVKQGELLGFLRYDIPVE